jgi:hypothetical protein
MRTAYRVVATAILIGVALQVASIAFGLFGIEADAEDGATIDRAYDNFGLSWHAIAGTVIGILALVLLILSFFTRIERGRTLAAGLVGLVLVQFVLATVAFGLPAIGALHGLNGLVIAGVAEAAARRAAKTPVAEPVAT